MDTAMPIVTYTYDPIGKIISITTDGVTEKADCTFPVGTIRFNEKPIEPHSMVVTYTFDERPELRAIFRPDGTVEEIDARSETVDNPDQE